MIEHPIFVLRHGQTEWNSAGKMQGRANSPLTEKGREQAQGQGRILQRNAELSECGVYCSPLGRTRETAALSLPAEADRLLIDERLAEIDMGDWTGRTRSDLTAEDPEMFDREHPMRYYRHIPNGESIEDVATRVESFLSELSGPSVLVTHGITSRILRCLVLNRPVSWFDRMPGGQGIVFRLQNGRQERLFAS